MYDDIWNLVLTSKSYNSSKSNHIPSDSIIEKLVQRNELLLGLIKDDKYKTELQNAIEQDYVQSSILYVNYNEKHHPICRYGWY